jgi:hypothetical protein
MAVTVTRTVQRRTDPCCICSAPVQIALATTNDPEAPEMVQIPAGAWSGIVRDEDHPGEVLLVVCCSDACVHALLREDA